MKTRYKLISSGVIIVLILIASVPAALALPPLPSSFYGTVKVDGANVPLGTLVSAWIDGVKYAETTVSTEFNGDTVYSLDVPGDDPATPGIIEGGVPSNTIVFQIGSLAAGQTAPWQSGINVALNLTADTAVPDVPPITTAAIGGTTKSCGPENNLYTGSGATVSLTPNEPAVTRYRVTNSLSGAGPWLTYSAPFSISAEGSNTIEFTSTDLAGYVEATQAITLKFTTFAATGVLDNFNRANGALGPAWSGSKSQSSYKLAGQKIDVGSGGPVYWRSGSPFGATQEAFVTLTHVDTHAREQDLLLKVQGGSSPNWTKGVIEVLYDARQRAVRVETYNPGKGVWTIYFNTFVQFQNGDQLGARAMADGTVRVYRNCVLLSVTDTKTRDGNFFVNKGGRSGLWFIEAGGAWLDDFGGGSVP